MPTITATVRTLPDTQAAVVRAGTHTLVPTAPRGSRAGAASASTAPSCWRRRSGLSGQRRARRRRGPGGRPRLGGHRRLARRRGDSVLDGLRIVGADVQIALTGVGGADTKRVVEQALEISAVLAAVREGFSVDIQPG